MLIELKLVAQEVIHHLGQILETLILRLGLQVLRGHIVLLLEILEAILHLEVVRVIIENHPLILHLSLQRVVIVLLVVHRLPHLRAPQDLPLLRQVGHRLVALQNQVEDKCN